MPECSGTNDNENQIEFSTVQHFSYDLIILFSLIYKNNKKKLVTVNFLLWKIMQNLLSYMHIQFLKVQ